VSYSARSTKPGAFGKIRPWRHIRSDFGGAQGPKLANVTKQLRDLPRAILRILSETSDGT